MTTTTTANDLLSRKAVVDKRWKLLRDALRGKPVNRQATFVGYEMICSRRLQQHDESIRRDIQQNLLILSFKSEEGTVENFPEKLVNALETSLLGLLSLDVKQLHDCKGSRSISCHEFLIPKCHKLDLTSDNMTFISDELCRRCNLDTCRVTDDKDSSSTAIINEQPHNILRVEISTSNRNRFLIRLYEWPKVITNDTSHNEYLLIRERSPEQVITLSEMTSHQRDHGIDNTGNVCVWDCEKTLLWALLSSSSPSSSSYDQTYGRVLELGAGMAGLVALGLGAAKRASHVIVTDGNPGSLQSNRTHVRLMEASKPIQCTVDIQLLPWALQVAEETDIFRELQSKPANITVVSDCTHFERYHGHLLWTLIQCTTVGGHIWMCHPNRGKTLERFLDVIRQLVKDNEPEANDLLSLHEMSFPELDEKYQLLTKNDPHYCPNVHRPRIFYLSKLREASENDRSRIIQHMATRDVVTSSD